MSFKSVLVFFLGLCWQCYGAFILIPSFSYDNTLRAFPLPVTSVLLYGLLCWLHVIIFTESFYADKGPSRTIRTALVQRPMTYEQILALFSNKILIERRIHNLSRDGLVREMKQRWSVTAQGKRLYKLLQRYRALLKWQSSG